MILTIYCYFMWAIAIKKVLEKVIDQEEIEMRYKVESEDWFMVIFAPLTVPMKFAIKLDRKNREKCRAEKASKKGAE